MCIRDRTDRQDNGPIALGEPFYKRSPAQLQKNATDDRAVPPPRFFGGRGWGSLADGRVMCRMSKRVTVSDGRDRRKNAVQHVVWITYRTLELY